MNPRYTVYKTASKTSLGYRPEYADPNTQSAACAIPDTKFFTLPVAVLTFAQPTQTHSDTDGITDTACVVHHLHHFFSFFVGTGVREQTSIHLFLFSLIRGTFPLTVNGGRREPMLPTLREFTGKKFLKTRVFGSYAKLKTFSKLRIPDGKPSADKSDLPHTACGMLLP